MSVCLLACCCCCPESVREKVLAIRSVWKLVITVYIVFFVTLAVFPGISSEVQYCTVGDWMPIILITTFNLSDCVSRVRGLSWAHWLVRDWSMWGKRERSYFCPCRSKHTIGDTYRANRSQWESR